MSKLLVPLLKIFLRKISRKSIELHTDDLSEISVQQNLSENLFENISQKDIRKVNRIEPLVGSHCLMRRSGHNTRVRLPDPTWFCMTCDIALSLSGKSFLKWT